MRYKTFDEMVAAAKVAIAESSQESGVYIGCDSVRRKKAGKFIATYATVIIVHRDSKHGGQMFAHLESQPDYSSMKVRLMNEVGYAVKAGFAIADLIESRPFEIHLDLNPNPLHKSNVAVKEATGYVLGCFDMKPILKPDGFAATYAADRLVNF
jgi:predicted RNase H-related nuclease YkuK (DUF458 family)